MTAQRSLSYWGKADPTYPGEPKWHPLAYHCLDVAAVACTWWNSCASLRGNFAMACPVELDKERLRAWILFFVALHDVGKFDLRFQLKAPKALAAAGRKLMKGKDHDISSKEITHFDHGHAGIAWARREYLAWLARTDDDLAGWSCWEPWLAAVTEHIHSER
jgi:CRISPR-associated endonuclease/helicase Cas3